MASRLSAKVWICFQSDYQASHQSDVCDAQFDVLLLESGERLYDNAALSAKYLSGVLTGHEFSTLIDSAAGVASSFMKPDEGYA